MLIRERSFMIRLHCCGTLLVLFLLFYRYSSSTKAEWNLHMLKTESNYHNYTLAAESGKKTMQEVLLNRYDCTSMEESLRIPDSLKFNNDACARINSMIIPCCEDLIEPKSDHSHKVIEITNIAWKYLLDENLVNEASCSTPMKRPNDIPSIESTEELRIQASKTYRERFNFQDGKLLKQASGDAKQQHQQQQHLIRASSVY